MIPEKDFSARLFQQLLSHPISYPLALSPSYLPLFHPPLLCLSLFLFFFSSFPDSAFLPLSLFDPLFLFPLMLPCTLPLPSLTSFCLPHRPTIRLLCLSSLAPLLCLSSLAPLLCLSFFLPHHLLSICLSFPLMPLLSPPLPLSPVLLLYLFLFLSLSP